MARLRSSAALLTVLCATACTPGSSGGEAAPPSPSPSKAATVRAKPVAAALSSFKDCASMVRTLRAEGLKEVTAYGLQQPGFRGDVMLMPSVPAPLAATGGGTTGGGSSDLARAAAPAAGTAHSTTTNQEADADEPDRVKTDGRHLVLIRQATSSLVIIDVTGAKPRQVGSLHVMLENGGTSLLLMGDTVMVLGQRYTSEPRVVAEVYSIADPAHPKHTRTYQVDGTLLDARLVHGRVVLVANSSPQLGFTQPQDPTQSGVQRSLEGNRRVINRATAEQWLPQVKLTPRTQVFQPRCDQASHPGVASGTSATTIVTLDPDQDEPTSLRTVVGGGETLYASSSALYLATSSWANQRRAANRVSGTTTDLHGFDISEPDAPRYLGTGSVPGSLINRYALSEHQGYLRVATTISDGGPSDSRVTVLKPTDGVLTKVGELTGLGPGERIFGVRFLGAVGYVVTFRQTDPLYTLDLSDPRRPKALGELKISGFSSQLYPLDEGRLLGVGQAATEQGRQLGAQAEVFDVSDLTDPRLVGRKVWPQSASLAAEDQHSLLWWPSKRLVVLPVMAWSGRTTGTQVLRVGSAGTLTVVGEVVAPGGQGNQCCSASGITRSLVVGDTLYSIADNGIVTNPLDEVSDQTWLPFP